MARKPSTKSHSYKNRDFEEIVGSLASFGIKSCSLGKRFRNGRYVDENVVTCYVDNKRAMKKGDPERVPRSLKYSKNGETLTVKTDVVEMPSRVTLQGGFNTGDEVSITNRYATVGFFGVHKEYGSVLVTAGHFASQVGGIGTKVKVKDASSSKTVVCEIKYFEFNPNNADIDYAFLLVDQNVQDSYSYPIRSIYQPILNEDVDRELYVYKHGCIEPTKTICRSFAASITDKKAFYKRVILTDPVTDPGDSGAALVDEHDRLWGILIGKLDNSRSVFMPIMSLLSRQNITLD